MDENSKKTALRMIPYGLYVLAARDTEGNIGGATINWVTQTSFNPPLVAIGVREGSAIYYVLKSAGYFALNFLGKDQQSIASAFFRAARLEDGKINGYSFEPGMTGAPILLDVPAYVECKVVAAVEKGDHSLFVGEVVNAEVRQIPPGRPDDAILTLKDLGENVFYGG